MLSIIKAALGPCVGCLRDFNKKLVIGLLPQLTVAFWSICEGNKTMDTEELIEGRSRERKRRKNAEEKSREK